MTDGPEGTTAQAPVADRTPPEQIVAVPVRHPGRWVAAAVLLVLAAMLVNSLVTNPAWRWDVVWKFMFNPRVLSGLWLKIELTALGMVIGIVLGVIIAIMR